MQPEPYKCEDCHRLPMEFFHKGKMLCDACALAEKELDQFKVLDLDDPDYLI